LFFIFLSPVNIGLFTGGFSSSSLVFLLLLWFQVIFGNIYQMTGVIFALFMAGLVAGSWYRPKLIKEANLRSFLFILSIMAVTAAVIAAVLLIPHLSTAFSWLLMIIILIFTFVTGTIMGLQFAIANSIRSESILKASGQSYSADLIGSAIGVILVSIYVIPLIGLVQTSLVITGINLMTVLIISLKTVMAKS
jgi:predicted membrane-bound spermidine synthase